MRSVSVFPLIPKDVEVLHECDNSTGKVCWELNDVTAKYTIWHMALHEIPYGIYAGAWASLFLKFPSEPTLTIEYGISGIAITPNGDVVGLDRITGKFVVNAN